MNNNTLIAICAELDSALVGRRFGKLFPLSPLRFAVDLRIPDQRFLFISAEPGSSRIHLMKRRVKDLERASLLSGQFALGLRRRLGGATVESVQKLPGERVVKIIFSNTTELGDEESLCLVVQLTGTSANLFLLDADARILDRARSTNGEGQEPADVYVPPKPSGNGGVEKPDPFRPIGGESLSEAVDRFYSEKEAREAFEARAAAARQRIRREISKRENLIARLAEDLRMHGDADLWKRFGDLLLANIADARRDGNVVTVVDYFDEETPTVEIEVDENDTLTEAAEKYFRRYTKARNAKGQIAGRIDAVGKEIDVLRAREVALEAAIQEGDLSVIENFQAGTRRGPAKNRQAATKYAGARAFVSSDGFEMLVGKGSKDNDHLTFRIARSGDLWLHAADYPGSHVVIRSHGRGEIPQRTLLQAAQLAAFYSDARLQKKAAVNYTLKKFVNKPRGAAPGLVSLSSFKTILVEPMVSSEISQNRTTP